MWSDFHFCAVLFGDVGQKAAGPKGRTIVYVIIYSLDATRCIILHLAATQSLQHALGDAAPPMWQCGLAILVLAFLANQVRLGCCQCRVKSSSEQVSMSTQHAVVDGAGPQQQRWSGNPSAVPAVTATSCAHENAHQATKQPC